jgi:hypothetical protein
MEKVGFGLAGMALNGGNQFWPDCNGLDWGKLALA